MGSQVMVKMWSDHEMTWGRVLTTWVMIGHYTGPKTQLVPLITNIPRMCCILTLQKQII